MAEGNGNGAGRIHLLNDHRAAIGPKTDDQGRVLKHNATVKDAHDIAIEEGNKVHEFYLKQVPPFVARMIQDALMAYGLIAATPEAQLAATPPEATPVLEGTGPSVPTETAMVADVATDGASGAET